MNQINQIYFSKVRPMGIIPSKRLEDGGYDIYPCFDEEECILLPHETKLIPTGIASAFAPDYVAILKERGSTGSIGIGQRAGIIDSGYRGEWFVAVTNHNEKSMVISKMIQKTIETETMIQYPYTKAIAQCLMVSVPKLEVCEVAYEDLLQMESQRGTGSLGSSGK